MVRGQLCHAQLEAPPGRFVNQQVWHILLNCKSRISIYGVGDVGTVHSHFCPY